MPTTRLTYWTDLNGTVACSQHLGMSATAVLSLSPLARTLRTDLTVWERMTKEELTEWMAFLEGHGETHACEMCRER